MISAINIATLTSIIGSILIATNINLNKIGFIFFLIGTIFWMVYGIKSKNKQIIIMNSVYFIINIVGLFRY